MSQRRKSGAPIQHQIDETATVDLTPSNAFQAWWNIDSDQSKQDRLQGAERLVQRCMNTYCWDREFTVKVLHAYSQFMKLKASFEDWEATSLWPSAMVDMMWHQHVLDTRHYRNDCFSLSNNMVHYGPAVPRNVDTTKLIETTKIALKARFGSQHVDDDIWTFSNAVAPSVGVNGGDMHDMEQRIHPVHSHFPSVGASTNGAACNHSPSLKSSQESKPVSSSTRSSKGKKRVKRSRPSNTAAQKSKSTRRSISSQANDLKLVLKDSDGDNVVFRVNSSAVFGQVKSSFAVYKEVEEKYVHFFHDGYPIPADATCADLDIEDGSEINVEIEKCTSGAKK
uniref:Ubiquitin-like domain-containing protein n=1 Tax=Odontella aurita TaxID=265563 RepID=A0A7S4HTJ2_9STRA|mmetsp:Transcript_14838/g.43281  ORF Transcript_14838/g.43281 Transcript_14838/m.43281 type:complete len:338 (+) Transcript_14838:172-1185(+)|eukprot:CAMPEP_0113565192 /NCGR_PEP_ID=MMETSP0015_2-20120614/22044_1 /TAXON_ID=2838 /ORGANISM="Odontella" /LENGTH=337 /DNA_ID=CAMNT_0000467369 /DNA_START=167 /DNA_END=1180 /DNA_ORIENTATION=- /assembly_acc=CAM_ASM_000160